MKKLMFLAVFAMVLTVFNACEKEVETQIPTKPLMEDELSNIGFSIDDNCLVFENEEEYQKCIDYLVKKGDSFFPEFEKTIGFKSYRLMFKDDSVKYSKIQDDLFATLINPDGYLRVGSYLFQVDFDKEKSYAYHVNNSGLKCASTQENSYRMEFNWEDDAFAILNGEPQLKSSGCGECKMGYYEFSTSCSTVQYKVVYQKSAFYFSLQSKIKQEGGLCCYISLTTTPSNCWWYRKGSDNQYFGDDVSYGGNHREDSYRPYGGSRGLTSYYFGVDFYYSDPEGSSQTAFVDCSC